MQGGAVSGPVDVEDLVSALLVASRVLMAVSARSLAALGDTVTIPQFRTLVALDGSGDLSLNRLAEILDVNASSAVRMIDRLVGADLVDRRENPDNRRQVILSLTESGRRTVRDVTERRRRDIARIVANMPAERRSELVTALRTFADASGESAPSEPGGALGW